MLARLERAAGVTRPIALVSSDGSLEPGVFGIWKPVLLWPRSIANHLDERQKVWSSIAWRKPVRD